VIEPEVAGGPLEEPLPRLTIVLPAWNEEAGIEDAVVATLACGDDLVDAGTIAGVEVVVVDDGSTDATAEILRRLAERDDRVEVVTHRANQGLGAAVRSGFGAASGDLVFYTDADLPIDLAEIDTAIRILRERRVDVVAAYRRSRRGEGARRFGYSLVYNRLARAALGLRVRDVNFAAKLFRREVLDAIEPESQGSFIDAELLGRAVGAGFALAQFPADYRPRSRGVSTLSSAPVIRQILAEMWHLAPEIRRGAVDGRR
jgi:glycosyltransferase involved in cell wall biosynthesis